VAIDLPSTASRQRQVMVLEDASAVAATAADRLMARVSRSGDKSAICLTGGDSPTRLYKLLSSEPYRDQLPWDRLHWFIGDDRFVPIDHGLSNMGMAFDTLLRGAAAGGHVHPIPTHARNPDAAARLYEDELKAFYGSNRLDPDKPLFDLVLMGVGPDGHTASLFPNSSSLWERERWVIGVEQAGVEPFVPRVTLTFPTLASTREMLFLACGTEKKELLAQVLSGEDLPASRAWSNGELVWLLDREAAVGR
jgi:6-phosphogluconolactonase